MIDPNARLPGSQSRPLLVASYLFHGAVHNLLPKTHLYSNHEGSGAAHGGQKALRDNRNVGVCPAEGVEQRSRSVDALRQGAGGRAHRTRVRGCAPTLVHPHTAHHRQQLLPELPAPTQRQV